jgi:hypothetical protein
MAQIPANQKMWNMLVAQAKTRYRIYPSPAASHWVHSHYVQLGGKFVESQKQVDPRFKEKAKRDVEHPHKDRKK